MAYNEGWFVKEACHASGLFLFHAPHRRAGPGATARYTTIQRGTHDLVKDRDLVADLQQLLTRQPGLTVRELTQRLHAYDWNVTQGDVQHVLLTNKNYFQRNPTDAFGWEIRPTPVRAATPVATGATVTTPAPPPSRPVIAPGASVPSALAGLPPLVRELAALVEQHPGRSASQLALLVGEWRGRFRTKGEVNQVLYGHPKVFRKADTAPPTWHRVAATGAAAPSRQQRKQAVRAAATLREVSGRLHLWSWQQRALQAWEQASYQGVVEAVTGTGKTRVGIAAAAWAAERGRRTLILVPTVDLQSQWYRVLLKALPRVSIGRLGDGERDSLADHTILISTVQSCYQNPDLTRGGGLLIADECHRYGGETWATALQTGFPHRLGLTATYERNDDGVERYLQPYFKQTVYKLHYEEALRDDVIAHFKIAFLGVQFARDEQADYDAHDSTVRWAKGKLIYTYGLPEKPFGTFIKEVNRLAEDDDEEGRIARTYLTAFTARRKVLAEARGKFRRMTALAEAARRAQGTIVFTQTKDAAADAAEVLQGQGLTTGFLHSEMDRSERRSVLNNFAEGDTDVIAAPKLLDEGIDVPAADLAIIVAASRTRLQMVQRMGRVLRKKRDGRLARVVIMYVVGTSEDPDLGAHDAFVDLITPVAADKRYFGPYDPADTICAYLNDYQPRAKVC
jgi:RNA polymerase primary sigma factor